MEPSNLCNLNQSHEITKRLRFRDHCRRGPNTKASSIARKGTMGALASAITKEPISPIEAN